MGKMKTKYRHRFDRVCFKNLWLRSERWNRGDIMIIGIKRWYSSHCDYKWQISIFGFEAHLWFIRTPNGHICNQCGTLESREWFGKEKITSLRRRTIWTCGACIKINTDVIK
jgi:hypothetical protein